MWHFWCGCAPIFLCLGFQLFMWLSGPRLGTQVGNPVEHTDFFISPLQAKSPADLQCQITFQNLGVSATFFFVSGRIFLEPVWPKQFHWTPMCPRSKKSSQLAGTQHLHFLGHLHKMWRLGFFYMFFLKNSVHQELQNFNY